MTETAERALPLEELTLPLIVAPMLRISGPDMVIAACRAGLIGGFPTANARTPEGLSAWLTQMEESCDSAGRSRALIMPNIIMRSEPRKLEADLDVLIQHRVKTILASVGSPAPIIERFHEIGTFVLSDVATLKHARKAVEAGVDGLILLTAGCGGQTGWLNGFAFIAEVRKFFDGPLVVSGGMSSGAALLAAEVLGYSLGMAGTPFIATTECMAQQKYKEMVVSSDIDDILLTQAFSGLDANMLAPSIVNAGIELETLPTKVSREEAAKLYSEKRASTEGKPTRWKDIWSAGHTVGSVETITSLHQVADRYMREYGEARSMMNKAML